MHLSRLLAVVEKPNALYAKPFRCHFSNVIPSKNIGLPSCLDASGKQEALVQLRFKEREFIRIFMRPDAAYIIHRKRRAFQFIMVGSSLLFILSTLKMLYSKESSVPEDTRALEQSNQQASVHDTELHNQPHNRHTTFRTALAASLISN
jgi:hypothetical protein